MDKNRFKQLLESQMGNVKPLIMEQPSGDTTTKPLTSYNPIDVAAKEEFDKALQSIKNIWDEISEEEKEELNNLLKKLDQLDKQ